MSFASEIKHEICQNQWDDSQNKAKLCALFLCRASIVFTSGGLGISFQCENANVAKEVFSMVKSIYGVEPRLSVLKKMRLKKNNIYRIQIFDKSREILEDLSIWTDTGFHEVPSFKMTRSEKNARAFLAGCFLATGSINHPKSSNYHMELVCAHEKLAAHIQKMLERFYIPAKITCRKEQYVVYVKVGEKIADFLRLVNAPAALFAFEDTRIQRDFYNSLTRLDNCEVANEIKSQKAAMQQLEYIRVLEAHENSIQIPEKIRQVMEIRKKYPEASINELCQEMLIAYQAVISKSGMKHRLAKIKELALPFMEKSCES